MKICLIYKVGMEFWINNHGCQPYPRSGHLCTKSAQKLQLLIVPARQHSQPSPSIGTFFDLRWSALKKPSLELNFCIFLQSPHQVDMKNGWQMLARLFVVFLYSINILWLFRVTLSSLRRVLVVWRIITTTVGFARQNFIYHMATPLNYASIQCSKIQRVSQTLKRSKGLFTNVYKRKGVGWPKMSTFCQR